LLHLSLPRSLQRKVRQMGTVSAAAREERRSRVAQDPNHLRLRRTEDLIPCRRRRTRQVSEHAGPPAEFDRERNLAAATIKTASTRVAQRPDTFEEAVAIGDGFGANRIAGTRNFVACRTNYPCPRATQS